MRFSLRQLEVFIATAHYQNVTRAAGSLAMSQSAASGALKDLESQFDIKLFDRVGKRLQTNEFGERIRVRAEALIAQAGELEEALLQHNNIGHLNIGATLTIGNYLCVDLIQKYMALSSDARVNLEVANTASIAEKILNFDIDLGLIEGELNHPDLRIQPWMQDELICFCSPEHPLAHKQKISDKDLLSANWILREKGSGTRQSFDRAMSGINVKLDIALELQHTEAIKRAVETNMGISCLSKITLEQAFARGSLTPLLVEHRNFSRSFYFVTHTEKYLSAGMLQWMKLCGLNSN